MRWRAHVCFGKSPPAHNPLGRPRSPTAYLAKVQAVPLRLKARRELRDSHRQAIVEVKGGALDGTARRGAVFLTPRQLTDLQIVTDLDEPGGADHRALGG